MVFFDIMVFNIWHCRLCEGGELLDRILSRYVLDGSYVDLRNLHWNFQMLLLFATNCMLY